MAGMALVTSKSFLSEGLKRELRAIDALDPNGETGLKTFIERPYYLAQGSPDFELLGLFSDVKKYIDKVNCPATNASDETKLNLAQAISGFLHSERIAGSLSTFLDSMVRLKNVEFTNFMTVEGRKYENKLSPEAELKQLLNPESTSSVQAYLTQSATFFKAIFEFVHSFFRNSNVDFFEIPGQAQKFAKKEVFPEASEHIKVFVENSSEAFAELFSNIREILTKIYSQK